MAILRIEHPVQDFDRWKVEFDRGEVRRETGGVRRYDIFRPIDDPHYIAVDLEFDGPDEADAFRQGLEELWISAQAARVLGGPPQTRIVDVVERRSL